MQEKRKKKGFFGEFRDFALRGSVVDLAVGVVIGGAFNRIVSSLVDYIISPILGIILGGRDFSTLSFSVGQAVFKYGAFLQSILDFLLIAFFLFLFVKSVNKLRETITPDDELLESRMSTTEKYLKEIRNLLKSQNEEPNQQNKK